jgi:Fur family ferric uptake transcriptional regulator
MDAQTVAQQLATRHFKLTRQRRAVLDAILDTQSRMSPAEVYERARRNCPDLGLATVYRTLEILDEIGVIRRVHMSDNCEGFAPATLPHGHHVICIECGRVTEFEGCDISTVLTKAARQTGFHIEEHWLELMGTCDECQSAKGKGR